MNKTIIININGTIFHIEEEAYEVLQRYMIDVKKHFGYSSDSDEIVADIENRIAEMFSERIYAQKEVINMQDVTEVCAQMGSVSDFEEEVDVEDIPSSSRTLFRDPDDRWLGGVCSGLAHYFDIESLWIRLAFAALFLFAGTGLLVYVLLWVLVPLAKTRTEKMQMRGERQNIHNFKRTFDEEVEGIRRNLTVAGNRVGPGFKKAARQTEDAVSSGARFIVKFVGAILIILCGFAIIAALATALAMLGVMGPASWRNLEVAHFFEPQYYGPMVMAGFLLAVIPCLLLLILSLRLFVNFKFSKYVGFTMFVLWLLALLAVVYFSTTVAMDFREDAIYTEKDSIKSQPIYFLDMNDTRAIHKINGKSAYLLDPELNRSFNDISTSVHIFPLPIGANPYVVKKFEASGGTFNIALKRAQDIVYDLIQQDSSIIFNSHGFIKHGLIRNQDIRVELYLPEGSIVYIDPKYEYFFRGVDFESCFEDSSDHAVRQPLEFIMGTSGLTCSGNSPKLLATDSLARDPQLTQDSSVTHDNELDDN